MCKGQEETSFTNKNQQATSSKNKISFSKRKLMHKFCKEKNQHVISFANKNQQAPSFKNKVRETISSMSKSV